MKYALVWGTSARHYPQHCGLFHHLEDEDVVQIVKKKVQKHKLFSDLCLMMRMLHQMLMLVEISGERRRGKGTVQVTLERTC